MSERLAEIGARARRLRAGMLDDREHTRVGEVTLVNLIIDLAESVAELHARFIQPEAERIAPVREMRG